MILRLVYRSGMIASAFLFALAANAATCHAVDGDTLRCGRERIRLLGIDAPELPGHCHQGRNCAPGDPFASMQSLTAALRSGPISIERVGQDRYGRTLALVTAGKVNVACWQLRSGNAVYVAHWDDGARVARACRR